LVGQGSIGIVRGVVVISTPATAPIAVVTMMIATPTIILHTTSTIRMAIDRGVGRAIELGILCDGKSPMSHGILISPTEQF